MPSDTVRNRRWMSAVVLVSGVLVLLSFILAPKIRSPWQEAVSNAKKEPLITAEITKRTISSSPVELTGNFAAGGTIEVVAPENSLPSVVTAVSLKAGNEVNSGDKLIEISGRPLFALSTPFAFYRDLHPGLNGPDVLELQTALVELGLYSGVLDGEYGAQTADAVSEWYRQSGYEPWVDTTLKEEAIAAKALVHDLEEQALQEKEKEKEKEKENDARSDVDSDDGPDVSIDLKEAKVALKKAEYAALPQLKRAEIVWIPEGDIEVLNVSGVGKKLDGLAKDGGILLPGDPIIRLRSGTPNVTVRVGVASRSSFEVGAQVTVLSPTSPSTQIEGEVTSIGDFVDASGGEDEQAPGYDMVLALPDSDLEDGVKVTVLEPKSSADEDMGLSVPLVAMRSDERGDFIVMSQGGRVDVRVLATGDGYAIIEGAGISEGAEVLISGDIEVGSTVTPSESQDES